MIVRPALQRSRMKSDQNDCAASVSMISAEDAEASPNLEDVFLLGPTLKMYFRQQSEQNM